MQIKASSNLGYKGSHFFLIVEHCSNQICRVSSKSSIDCSVRVDVRHHTTGNSAFGKYLYAHSGFPDGYMMRDVAFLQRLAAEIWYIHDVAWRSLGVGADIDSLWFAIDACRDSEISSAAGYGKGAVFRLLSWEIC
jgi:hypothetical protein